MSKCCSTCRWLGPVKTSPFEVGLSEAEMKKFCEERASEMLPGNDGVSMIGKPPVVFGECRLNPPSVFHAEGMAQTSFPIVGSGDWCGRHEPSMGDAKS